MIKKILLTIFVVFNLLAVAYLLAPLPKLPDLTDSVKSDLPGDTTQLKNVSAYFTNLSRSEVTTFYKANFNGLFRIKLNHPPERSRDVIVDTMQSNYLEEYILPLEESVFINGFEWQNDPFTKEEKKVVNKLIYHDQEYFSKVTIKVFPTTVAARLITFFTIEAAYLFAFIAIKKVFFTKNG